jgi:hypothetical protein
MLRSLSCACLALVLCGVVVLAGEFRGVVTKSDPDKHTIVFQQMDKKEKVGDPVELSVKDAKILKATFDKETKMLKTDPLEGGLKADTFTKADPEKGVRVTIVAEGDKLTKDSKVSEVRTFAGKGGK